MWSQPTTVTDEWEGDTFMGGFARQRTGKTITLNNLDCGKKHRGSCFTPVLLMKLKDYTGPFVNLPDM